MIRLTKTGWLFLGFSVLFYFAALTSQSSLLLLLIGIILGCGLVNLVAARRAVKALEIHTPSSVHLCEGERMAQSWKIMNRGTRPADFIQADSGAGVLFRMGTIQPGSEARVVPDLVFEKRGVYFYSQISLSSVYPFGFIKAARRFNLPGEVVVCPAVYDTQLPRASGYDAMLGGKLKGGRRAASGSSFAGVRPFQEGDPWKQIHWKSSAKGLGLMVKTFDEELSGRAAFIMDCGHADDPKLLDDCIRATGSLMFAALDAGHHVEWIDLHHLDLLLVPPFADGHEILDRLARVVSAPGRLTEGRLRAALERTSKKSAIHLALTEFNAAAAAAIDWLQSHHRVVSLYLPENSNVPAGLEGVPMFAYSERAIVELK